MDTMDIWTWALCAFALQVPVIFREAFRLGFL